MDAINTWYCHPDIPFGQNQPVTNITAEPGTNPIEDPVYVKTLADPSRFPEDIHDGSNKTIHRPVELYHSLLSNAKDQSVTILAIGFMSNLAAFYSSPGGRELISKKVKELVVQGGDFGPRGPDGGPNGANYNLGNDLTAAKVLQTWPSPVTFLGVEVGGAVLTGKILQETPVDNPVRVAYEIYNNGTDVENKSWDLVTAYFAVLGLEEGSLRYGNGDRGGRIEIYPNGTAAWNYSASVPFTRRQHFLDFRETNVTVARKIDALLATFGSQKPPCPTSQYIS
ncbi:inosine-uridine preferring nucleoside hydrolase-domain-containing protein [Hysterangium stoloniferum]|nr:inosine-uridine preferring nucleoside hydrolase-domain-containing protein [Hysterangium stoloniferum]